MDRCVYKFRHFRDGVCDALWMDSSRMLLGGTGYTAGGGVGCAALQAFPAPSRSHDTSIQLESPVPLGLEGRGVKTPVVAMAATQADAAGHVSHILVATPSGTSTDPEAGCTIKTVGVPGWSHGRSLHRTPGFVYCMAVNLAARVAYVTCARAALRC